MGYSKAIAINFRDLKLEEVKKSEILIKSAFDRQYRNDCTKEGVKSFYQYINFLSIRKRMETSQFVVATHQDKIIGLAELINGNHLALFFIAPKWQERGIGKRFLQYLITTNQEKEDRFNLSVNASPGSQGFYAQMGFLRVGSLQWNLGIPYYYMTKNAS